MASVKKAASSFAKEIRRSATKFGKISPLGQIFKNIRQTFEALFRVWPNFET